MRISLLTIGAIASILSINSVFATTSTVTSKDYVDAADALKQNKIPATGTNANTPGSTVVTYTDTAGAIGERGIWEGFLPDADSDLVAVGALQGDANTVIVRDILGLPLGARGIYDGSTTYDSSTDADKLVTASVVQNVSDNMPRTTVAYKTCTEWVAGMPHSDNNCLLWALDDKNVYGGCTTYQDCNGSCKMCVDGACVEDPDCDR